MLKRAFLIDDDAVFRLGLSRVLADEFAIETVGSCDLGSDCCGFVSAARFDLLMLAPANVGPAPPDWMHALVAPPREFTVVLLVVPQSSIGVRELVACGAEGLLLKPFGVRELSQQIGAINRDDIRPYDPSRRSAVLARLRGPTTAGYLSERELLVVRRTADGRTSAQIAKEFGISVKTAERYRRAILSKLKLHSVAELTKFAVREGYTAL